MDLHIENFSQYERTSQTIERRRSLFPFNTVDESDNESDLGCISTLSSSSFEECEDTASVNSNTIQDYDIIGIVKKPSIILDATPEKANFSLLIDESPVNTPHSITENDLNCSSMRMSPSCNLKTPHDNVSVNSKLPKLSHKSVTDPTTSDPNKNNLSPYLSPKNLNKSCKGDTKSSKVRTTLFPELDLFLPTKKFYSSNETVMEPIKEFKINPNNSSMNLIKEPKKIHGSTSARKRYTSKKRFAGTINAGVRHKIRKPRKKRLTTLPLGKSTMSETQANALKNYLESLKELRATTVKTDKTENKENTHPDESTTHVKEMEIEKTNNLVNPLKNSENQTQNSFYVFQHRDNTCQQTNNFFTNESFNSDLMNNQHNLHKPGEKSSVQSVQQSLQTSINEGISKKRPLSPEVEEPDVTKKFFKFSRGHKGIVTMNKTMKLIVDHGKVSLMEKPDARKVLPQAQPQVQPQIQLNEFDTDDFIIDEPLMSEVIMDNILSTLEDSNVSENETQEMVPKADPVIQNKILPMLNPNMMSPSGSVNIPNNNTANLILSPISQMCDVTSGLALNSPKKVKNLSSLINDISRSPKKQLTVSLKASSDIKKRTSSLTQKKIRKLHKDQLLLDAGQKKFGVTQCPECNFVYHIGDPSDEICHSNYHDAVPVLKFSGWKNERIVADFQKGGRIIQIKYGDPKLWWKRVTDLMEVVNREMGCYNMEFNLDNSKVFLYIKSKTIVGCLVAVQAQEGYRMLTTKAHESDLCSERSFPVKCGVARIWVSKNFRKQGVGSALMNCLKNNFLHGYILSNNEIAFSSPTEMGKTFAKKYFNTPNFMIYFP